eukprot:320913-Pyramimonas_sp.AAC.1
MERFSSEKPAFALMAAQVPRAFLSENELLRSAYYLDRAPKGACSDVGQNPWSRMVHSREDGTLRTLTSKTGALVDQGGNAFGGDRPAKLITPQEMLTAM